MQKVLGAVGLARRAGKCITGDFAVERAVKGGKALLVIVDASASDATKKRYQTICNTHAVLYREFPGAGAAAGKPGGKIIAIVDEGFVGMIEKAYHAAQTEQ
ncbi:hypothetical protein LJC07_02020 [Christensenellaceae bacterium OttesenSCG-928-L17]|nr:hypothetical protein [Christensenellaceae bacterium OttesenSCG-928-L17]